MTSTTCNLSVIICAYTLERWHDLEAAVASLHQQTQQANEIILVIDHNTHLFDLAKKMFLDIIVAENKGMPGLSSARNTGIGLANGEYIIFLDDDAEAEPDWLERLMNCCVAPHVLGVGGTVLPRWQGEKPRWFPPEFYWVVGCTYHPLPQSPVIVRNPYGGCACIKREVFQKIGGFREGIGRVGPNSMGGEETELSIRAMQRWPEKVFLYEPRALIHHRIPDKRTRLSYFLTRCYAEGLSKAMISKCVGIKDSLSSERMYTLYTLPRSILKNTGMAVMYRDLASLLRAGAIMLGFAMTIAGYLRGYVQRSPLQSITSPAQQTQPSGYLIASDDSTQTQIF
ncbi:MAG TPA: glycosyltransferase [Ktedonobacteraceae bacterium]|nr:glycosyltransferase [Ktedonobacteraceae bacterium]